MVILVLEFFTFAFHCVLIGMVRLLTKTGRMATCRLAFTYWLLPLPNP